MPRPMTGNDEQGSEHIPERTPERALERGPRPAEVPDGPRDPERDSAGRELAMRLPDWDLVPPTEFLDRTRGR